MNKPLPLYRPEQVRALDEFAIGGLGIAAYELMCRAGAAAFRHLCLRWPDRRWIGIACGPGNNGGDGYVLARLARAAGMKVTVLTPPGGHPRTPAARQALADWRAAGGRVSAFDGLLPEAGLWVDALYGIGLTRPPSDVARAIIERINASGRPVLALDVPSGVDADSGHVPGIAIRADLTVSFIAGKRGCHTGAGLNCVGEVLIEALDLPDSVHARVRPAAWLARPADLGRWLEPRQANTHKGEHGHVLCIGGEAGMGGAVRLCAEAALRTGVGLASVATRESGVAALVAARPEAMTH